MKILLISINSQQLFKRKAYIKINNQSKRFMLSRCHYFGHKLISHQKYHYGVRAYAKHSVHQPSIMNTNHEENLENPILTKTNKKGIPKPLQHHPVTKAICDKPGCTNLICPNLCGKLVETRAVGHGTHSKDVAGKQVRRISNTDFDNQPQEQYMVYYENRPLSNLTQDTVNLEGSKKLTDDYQIYEKFYDK